MRHARYTYLAPELSATRQGRVWNSWLNEGGAGWRGRGHLAGGSVGGGEDDGRPAAGVTRGIFPMNLDRQMQRKPFPGTCFGHDSSSAFALRFNLKPENNGIPGPEPDEQLSALYHGKYSRRSPDYLRNLSKN